MKHETKPLTLKQRIECNKNTGKYDADGSIVIDLGIDVYVKYLRFGLKSLNGIDITEANFDDEINKLSNDEIIDIGNKIAEETNFPNKKK